MQNLDQNSLARLINQTGAYEGAGIPNRPQNGFRVRSITNLKVLQQINKLGGSLVTLGFNEENTGVKSVYYAMAYLGQDMSAWAGQNLMDESITKKAVIQGPYIFYGSPITLFLQSEIKIPAFITVTTRLPGGVISELAAQPGASVIVTPLATYYGSFAADVSLPNNKNGYVALIDNTAASRTVTFPDISGVIDGYTLTVKNMVPASANTVTVQGAVAAQTIDGAVTAIVPVVRTYMANRTTMLWYCISTA